MKNHSFTETPNFFDNYATQSKSRVSLATRRASSMEFSSVKKGEGGSKQPSRTVHAITLLIASSTLMISDGTKGERVIGARLSELLLF